MNDGVVAGWTFDDGKVTDSIGKAHGELFKAAKIVDKGRFGKALDVNGSQDTRVDIEFNPALEKDNRRTTVHCRLLALRPKR